MVQEIVLCDDRTRERNMFGDLRTKSPCCQEYENALAPILCTLCHAYVVGSVSHGARQNALVKIHETPPWCAVG